MEKFGKIDILLAAADENKEEIQRYKDYVEDGGLLLSTKGMGIKDGRVIYFQTEAPNIIRKIPTPEEPLTFRALPSFALLILIVTIAGCRYIDLYGADGGELDGELYWGDWPSSSRGRLDMDTKIMNENFPVIMKRVCKLYGIDEPEIINHSERSHYTCFPKLSSPE